MKEVLNLNLKGFSCLKYQQQINLLIIKESLLVLPDKVERKLLQLGYKIVLTAIILSLLISQLLTSTKWELRLRCKMQSKFTK